MLFCFASFYFCFSVFFILLSECFSSFEYQMFSLFVLNMLDLLFYFFNFIFHFSKRILNQMSVFLEFLLLLMKCSCFLLNFFGLFKCKESLLLFLLSRFLFCLFTCFCCSSFSLLTFLFSFLESFCYSFAFSNLTFNHFIKICSFLTNLILCFFYIFLSCN